MFASAPVTGHGAGTWVADRIALTQATETDYYIPHAHNLYAQTAAEHGLLGLLAGAVVIGCLAWLILGAPARPGRRPPALGLGRAVRHRLLRRPPAARLLRQLPGDALRLRPADRLARRDGSPLDHHARVDPGGPAADPPAAGRRGRSGRRRRPRASRWWASSSRRRPRRPWLKGGPQPDAGTGLPRCRSSAPRTTRTRAIPAYAFARGLAEARAGDPAAALAALAGVGEADDLPVAWLDVAALRLDAGDATGAREALDRALRLGRQQPAIVFATGALLERVGDPAGADAAWSATLRSLPSLAGDPWWADPARAARWTGIRDAALAGMAPEAAADLWLSSGDAEQASASASQIADPAPASGRSSPSQPGTATRRTARPLDAYAQDHPFDLVAVAWAGRVAARVGDLAAVADYRLWADTVVGTAGGAVGEIRVAPNGIHRLAGRPDRHLLGPVHLPARDAGRPAGAGPAAPRPDAVAAGPG